MTSSLTPSSIQLPSMKFPSGNGGGSLAPHIRSRLQEASRNFIEEQARILPSAQREKIMEVLKTGREEQQAIKKAEDDKRFRWMDLPPEVKNLIFRELLVSGDIIVPEVSDYRTRTGWTKYDLGANVLLCNKEIYKQALPVLLGDNVFHLNNTFTGILGKGTQRRRLRGAMVRKLVSPVRLETQMASLLKLLSNLEEVTIYAEGWAQTPVRTPEQGEVAARNDLPGPDNALYRMIVYRQEITFEFVSARPLRRQGVSPQV